MKAINIIDFWDGGMFSIPLFFLGEFRKWKIGGGLIKKRSFQSKGKDELRINDEIRINEVRLVGADGEQIGIVKTSDALTRAYDVGLDLVEVAPMAKPPVCKIMDYGKYKYEQLKKQKMAKKKQHNVTMKEIKLSPRIDQHDLDVKLKHARKFIEAKNRVKFSMFFRGREMAYIDNGKVILDKVAEELSDVAMIEKEAKLEGRRYIMYLAPKRS